MLFSDATCTIVIKYFRTASPYVEDKRILTQIRPDKIVDPPMVFLKEFREKLSLKKKIAKIMEFFQQNLEIGFSQH